MIATYNLLEMDNLDLYNMSNLDMFVSELTKNDVRKTMKREWIYCGKGLALLGNKTELLARAERKGGERGDWYLYDYDTGRFIGRGKSKDDALTNAVQNRELTWKKSEWISKA